MIWKAIVIITVMGAPTFQLHDTLKTGYSTTQECYARASMMLREMVMNSKMPVVQAVGICIDLPAPAVKKPPEQKPKGKPI